MSLGSQVLSRLLALGLLLALLPYAPDAHAGMSSSADRGPKGMSSSADRGPKGMSSSAIVVLEALLKMGEEVQVAALPDITPYVVVGARRAYYGDAEYFEQIGLRRVLDYLLARRATIDALSVLDDGSWALASSMGPRFSDAVAYRANGLGRLLYRLHRARLKVNAMARSDRGGYVLVIGNFVLTRGALPTGLGATIDRFLRAGARVSDVAIAGERWAVVADGKVLYSHNPYLGRALVAIDPQPRPGPVGIEPNPSPVGIEPNPSPVGIEPNPSPIGFEPGPIGLEPGPIGLEPGPIGLGLMILRSNGGFLLSPR